MEKMYDYKLFEDMPALPSKKRTDWINNFKIKLGCCKCGYNKQPEALHFHHIENKNFAVSKMKNMPTWKVIKEIFNCCILCANCHIEMHKETE
jgi:hypothetical protein